MQMARGWILFSGFNPDDSSGPRRCLVSNWECPILGVVAHEGEKRGEDFCELLPVNMHAIGLTDRADVPTSVVISSRIQEPTSLE